jgi:hypothetical protein
MRQVAEEAFAVDATLDAVEVHEHGGWYLTFLRDGTIVGSANRRGHPPSRSCRLGRRLTPPEIVTERGWHRASLDKPVHQLRVRSDQEIQFERECWQANQNVSHADDGASTKTKAYQRCSRP